MWGFAKHSHPRKLWNAVKLKTSYWFKQMGVAGGHLGYPLALSIEPTTACNLGCSQCPSGLKSFSRPTGNVQIEQAKKWMQPLLPYLYYLNFYFQGEPLIHPQLPELIKEASQGGVATAISTNAHFLNPKKCEQLVLSGLSKIIISLDGTEQKSYEKYREGGSLDKVYDGIKNLVLTRKNLNKYNPFIEVQFIVFKHNEHEIPRLKKHIKALGVDKLSLKTAQIYSQDSADELLPTNKRYLRYRKQKDGAWVLKNTFKNSCWRMWSSAVITQHGAVVPCCFDKDAEHNMGHLDQDAFISIRRNHEYKAFTNRVFSDRKNIGICKNCSEGSKIY